jgi:surface protein
MTKRLSNLHKSKRRAYGLAGGRHFIEGGGAGISRMNEEEEDEENEEEEEEEEEEDEEGRRIPKISNKHELQIAIYDYINGNRKNYIDIALWDISQVNDFNLLFTFIQIDIPEKNEKLAGIGEWKVGHVTSMMSTFEGCTLFNQPLNNWNVSKVKNMSKMFKGCISFDQPLNRWNVSRVKNMSSMFEGCTSFNQPIEWDVNPSKTNIEKMFEGCVSLLTFPYWYMSKLNITFPKKKGNFYFPTGVKTKLIAGVNIPNGVPFILPSRVDPFESFTMGHNYWKPQEKIANDFIKTLGYYEKALLRQYTLTRCYLEEVDCYVGNRLTTYLLTKHPEIISTYPQYQNPLVLEEFSHTAPVVFQDRYITPEKILTILKGFRDLNTLLKRFPVLDETEYPNSFYLYRAKGYEGEIEKLAIGEEFILSKLTSTSMDVLVSRDYYCSGVRTRYKENGALVTKTLGFFWRIRMPLGLPFPCIGNEGEAEVLLPLGTKLRYLGCHVQPIGPDNIFTRNTEINRYGVYYDLHGALICEFEVVEITEGPLLQVLVDTVKQDFASGNSAIYAKDLTIPGDWDKYLSKKEIKPDEAFGVKRKTNKNKTKKKQRRTKKSQR